MTVNSILASVATGDESAMKACLDRYGGLVWSLAIRLTNRREDAEDRWLGLIRCVGSLSGKVDTLRDFR